MHLALIVQLSIALVAGEFARRGAGMPAWSGALALAAGPLWSIGRGWFVVRAAFREMDRGIDGSARFDRFHARAPWVATAAMLVAVWSGLPASLAAIGGKPLVVATFALAGISATLLCYAHAWSIDRRLRESATIRMLDASRPLHALPGRGAYVFARARAGLLPMLAPLLVPLLASELARMVALRVAPEHAASAQIGGALAGAILLFALVPVLVPAILGLRRLEPGELRDDLESLARDAGLGVREIWVWPTEGLVANAAVMGLLPGLRCVMLSDCLLECMPRAQVRAVMAHELGHVRRHHLPWMTGVIIGCWTIAGVLAALAAESALPYLPPPDASAASPDLPLEALAFVRDAAALAGGLWLFGFASRRFERQADTFAVQLLSTCEGSAVATDGAVEAMRGALASVAFLNHVPAERPSWRHGSIAWRREYLAGIAGRPLDRMAIDRLVALIAVALTLVGVAGIALSALLPAA
jgi:Zn-dependent protease with chaperone function